MNDAVVDPTEPVVHEPVDFAPSQHPLAAAQRADARIPLQTKHLDALHVRDDLADALGVDMKDL